MSRMESINSQASEQPRSGNNIEVPAENRYTPAYVSDKISAFLRKNKNKDQDIRNSDFYTTLESALARNGSIDIESIIDPEQLDQVDGERRMRIVSILGSLQLDLNNLVQYKDKLIAIKVACERISNVTNPSYPLEKDNEAEGVRVLH